mmetsp:Transcript_107155/g.303018  ORF Transcript_107155/g.303018 Transcript_107155/m.303018 type:complete len:294 (+) Transcript_107155:34-915(+)
MSALATLLHLPLLRLPIPRALKCRDVSLDFELVYPLVPETCVVAVGAADILVMRVPAIVHLRCPGLIGGVTHWSEILHCAILDAKVTRAHACDVGLGSPDDALVQIRTHGCQQSVRDAHHVVLGEENSTLVHGAIIAHFTFPQRWQRVHVRHNMRILMEHRQALLDRIPEHPPPHLVPVVARYPEATRDHVRCADSEGTDEISHVPVEECIILDKPDILYLIKAAPVGLAVSMPEHQELVVDEPGPDRSVGSPTEGPARGLIFCLFPRYLADGHRLLEPPELLDARGRPRRAQ